MAVYRSGNLTYNPDAMEQAIISSKKIDSSISSLKSEMSGIVGTLPAGFSSAALSSATSGLSNLESKLNNISSVLISIKNEMDNVLEDEMVMSELFNKCYSEVVTLSNGQSGYLFIPKG